MNEFIWWSDSFQYPSVSWQFGALHLPEICTCSSPNGTNGEFDELHEQILLSAVRRTAPITDQFLNTCDEYKTRDS